VRSEEIKTRSTISGWSELENSKINIIFDMFEQNQCNIASGSLGELIVKRRYGASKVNQCTGVF